MAEVNVLIPVLERPGRVAPLMESLRNSVGPEHALHELFLCSPGDDEEIAAITSGGFDYAVMEWPAGDGDFAMKTNTGVALTDREWVFVGADDLYFHPGWLDACLATHKATGALVIGVNDMGNPTVMRGHYATQMLVHRDYATNGVIDAPGLLLCEEFSHNCVDTELVETARFRGTFASARDARVEHLHHVWKKSVDDATYAKGREKHLLDRQRLQRRRHLWSPHHVASGRQVVNATRRITRSSPTHRWKR